MKPRAEIVCGDCLIEMPKLLERGLIFDACLADIPYGTTACSWDSVILFAPMWANLKRIVKRNGAIVLFGSQPFTSALVMSNPEMFKYEIIWEKPMASGFFNADFQPLKAHENLLVFSRAAATFSTNGQMVFNPQFAEGKPYFKGNSSATNHQYHSSKSCVTVNDGRRYPRSVVEFSNPNNDSAHGTQKPVELMRYLVRTYTNEGDTILDFTCGSGSTGVACMIENRNFIGIEKDEHYAEIARARISRAQGIPCDIPKRERPHAEMPLFDAQVA